MKLLKAIRDADALRPNKLSTPRKAEILMVLEHRIAEMMGAEAPTLKVSVEDDTASVEDTELLLPDGKIVLNYLPHELVGSYFAAV